MDSFGWKERLGSVFVAVIGWLMSLQGMTQGTGWTELPGLITPMAFFGGALIVYRAFMGQGQMKPKFTMPKGFKPTKKKLP